MDWTRSPSNFDFALYSGMVSRISVFLGILYPLFLSAVSYVILALLNSISSQGKLEMRLLVINGNCLMIDSGWVDSECIYIGVLFGFLKGKYFPVFKLKETSEKSVSMRFVSIVIDSPSSLNKLIMSFLNLSTLGLLALCTMASPSSLHKPTLLEPKRGLILFRRYDPTSSHTSAPSKLPIVTSNNGFPFFLTKAPLSSNNKYFLAWFMVLIIFPSISIKEFAKLIDLSSSSIWNRRIKFSDITFDKSTFCFIFDSFKLFNYVRSASPLVVLKLTV